jgi:hypothetical protein
MQNKSDLGLNMPPEIIEVRLFSNFTVYVKFENGTERIVDMKKLFNEPNRGEYFESIKNNVSLFLNPEFIGRRGIIWDDNADLGEYEILVIGEEVKTNNIVVA